MLGSMDTSGSEFGSALKGRKAKAVDLWMANTDSIVKAPSRNSQLKWLKTFRGRVECEIVDRRHCFVNLIMYK
jgi:hypothetical protein